MATAAWAEGADEGRRSTTGRAQQLLWTEGPTTKGPRDRMGRGSCRDRRVTAALLRRKEARRALRDGADELGSGPVRFRRWRLVLQQFLSLEFGTVARKKQVALCVTPTTTHNALFNRRLLGPLTLSLAAIFLAGIWYGYEKKAHIAWPGPGQSVRPGQHAAEFACGRHNVRPGNFATAEHVSIPGMGSELGSVALPLAIFENF